MRDISRPARRVRGWAVAWAALVGVSVLGADPAIENSPTPAASAPSATATSATASASATPFLKREVTTYAGTGQEASGDGPLLTATFAYMRTIASDPDRQSLYVTDKNEIRELTKNGTVVTVAGAAASGNVDGKGTDARFNSPIGIAYDSVDKALYICDYDNFEIRRMTPDGSVTTIAGSTREGRQDGTGPDAGFSHPGGIAFDSQDGALYVVDRTNNAVRRVTTSGVVTTVAGSREGFADGVGANARFDSPWGIAFDGSDGDLYVADSGNARIRRVTTQGSVTTIAGGSSESFVGPHAMARWGVPTGIAWDNVDGSLYVIDRFFSTVRRISAQGVVSNVAGNGSNGRFDGVFEGASFDHPFGITVDPATGFLYVADFDNNLVRLIR